MMNAKMSVAVVLLMGLASAEANLLANGDFEQGDTGFQTSYTYDPTPNTAPDPLPGQYVIGDNSRTWNGNFLAPGMSDHTSGAGLMLLADGQLNTIVWSQTVPVLAGVEYRLSGWYTSLGSYYLPRLEFLVGSDSLGIANTKDSTWEQFSQTWVASISGDVTLSIRDKVSAGIGNDFALDDLSFEAIPEPATASLFGLSAFGAMWMRRRRRFKGCFIFFTPSGGSSFDAPRKSKVNAAPKKTGFSLSRAVAGSVGCTLNESRQVVHSKMIAAEDAFYGSIGSTLRSVGNAAKKADRAFWNLFI